MSVCLLCVCVCVWQLRVVSGRTVLNCLRNPQTSYAQLALSIFFALLMGTIYYQIPLTLPEALQNRYGTSNTSSSMFPLCFPCALFLQVSALLLDGFEIRCQRRSEYLGKGYKNKIVCFTTMCFLQLKNVRCSHIKRPLSVSVCTTGAGRSFSSLSTWSFRTYPLLNFLSTKGRSSCEWKIRLVCVRVQVQMYR